MPGMPYHLEKGPLLSVLDDFFNSGSEARLLTALNDLRSGMRLTDVGVFDSTNLYDPNYPWPYQNRGQLVAHFEQHWLGNPPLNPMTAGTQTGHWQFYQGPVETIIRETLIRALELVLGIKHGKNNPTPTRHWPIDFWWKCPQPWFEGWLTWRQSAGSGHVTVIFATPADDGVVLREPATEATPAPARITTDTEGSLLVSAERHNQTVQYTVMPTGLGNVIFPTTWTQDSGGVVTLKPNFGSGGARNGGLPYTP
jgi:hypothetical protein